MFAYIDSGSNFFGGTGGHSSLFMSWLNFRGKTVYVESGKEEKRQSDSIIFPSLLILEDLLDADLNGPETWINDPRLLLLLLLPGEEKKDKIPFATYLHNCCLFSFPEDENIFPKKKGNLTSAHLYFLKTLSTPCFPSKGASLVSV